MINMPVFVLLPTVSQNAGSCKFITSLFTLPPRKKKVTYLKLILNFFLALSGREKGESGGGQLQSSSPMHLCFKCSLCKPRSGTFLSFFLFFLCSRSVMCSCLQMKWIGVKAAGTFFFLLPSYCSCWLLVKNLLIYLHARRSCLTSLTLKMCRENFLSLCAQNGRRWANVIFFFLILIHAVIVTSHLPDGGKPHSRKQQQAGDRITH